MGRPSKYEKKYSQECPEEIRALPTEKRPPCLHLLCHMARGKSLESFAFKIGVDRTTLYAWEEEHEDFSHAIKRGRDASLSWWEDLVQMGTGGQLRAVTGETFDSKGRLASRKYRAAHFHPVGAIFTMKNRFPTLYRDRIDLRHSGDPNKDDMAGKTMDELYAESEKLHEEIKRARKK